DLATDEIYGFGLPANKLISSGVGRPVAPAAVGGFGVTVDTSAADNDSVYVQQGILSAATRLNSLYWTKNTKFAVVANLQTLHGGAYAAFGSDLPFGFLVGGSTPNTAVGIGFFYD